MKACARAAASVWPLVDLEPRTCAASPSSNYWLRWYHYGSRISTENRGVLVQLVQLRRGGHGWDQPHHLSHEHPHHPRALLRQGGPTLDSQELPDGRRRCSDCRLSPR